VKVLSRLSVIIGLLALAVWAISWVKLGIAEYHAEYDAAPGAPAPGGSALVQFFWIGIIFLLMAAVLRSRSRRADRAAKDKRKQDEAAEKDEENVRDGVFYVWGDLRISSTQLIEGYESNAPRHSLAGLKATVESTGNVVSDTHEVRDVRGRAIWGSVETTARDERQVHVRIEGPRTGLVYTVKLKDNPNADAEAREFAAQLNLARRELKKR
jgi:hypothetical protein